MSGEAILQAPPKDPMWGFRSPPIMQGLRVRDDISRCSRSSKQDLYSAMGWPVLGMYAPIIVSCFVVSEASVILMARNLSLLMLSTGVTQSGFHHKIAILFSVLKISAVPRCNPQARWTGGIIRYRAATKVYVTLH